MVVGETLTARHSESAATNFTVDSASVGITAPDSSVVTPAPTVAILPNTPALTQELQAHFTATMGGIQKFVWSISVGGEVLKRPETYLATWTNAFKNAADRMNEAGYDLTQELFDRIAANLILIFQNRYPAANYSLLTSPDRELYDNALALITAYRAYPSVRPGGLNGPEVERRQGDTSYRWAQPKQTVTDRKNKFLTERDEWIAEATESLSRVSGVRATQVGLLNRFNPFSVDGLQGTLRARGLTQDLAGVVRGIASAPFPEYAEAYWPDRAIIGVEF